jgi:hypothetical protein
MANQVFVLFFSLLICFSQVTLGYDLANLPSNAARQPAGKSNQSFFVGLKGGLNFSIVSPINRFSVLQGMDGSAMGEKDYTPFFRNTGYQYGFVGLYKFKDKFSLSLEPSLSDYRYGYRIENSWYETSNPGNRIDNSIEVTNHLKYFEIPLVLRYEYKTGNFRPYLSAGFMYGMLTGAPATFTSTITQLMNDVEIPLENTTSAGDITGNYIHTRLVVFPGAGFFYDLPFLTFFFEADLFFGLNNVVNESARYSNQQVVGSTYVVPDNIRFDNLVFNIGMLFNINQKESGGAVDCPTFIKKR